jgi:hypothetical protein
MGFYSITLDFSDEVSFPIFLTNHWTPRAGGKPFFVLALVTMLPVLWLLRRSEKNMTTGLLGHGLTQIRTPDKFALLHISDIFNGAGG